MFQTPQEIVGEPLWRSMVETYKRWVDADQFGPHVVSFDPRSRRQAASLRLLTNLALKDAAKGELRVAAQRFAHSICRWAN